MASLIANALYRGLVRAVQRRSLSLLPLWALSLLGYWLGKLLARWKPQQSRAALLEPAGGFASAAAASNLAAEPSALLLPGGPAPAPVCAVVVPACVTTEQQGARLQRLITRLSLEQDRPPNFLIMIDDCSPLAVTSLLPAACRQPSEVHPSLVVERLPAPCGPAAARNAGLLMAASMGAQVVLLTEAECLPEQRWVGAMLAAHTRRPGIVVGRTCAARPDTAVGRFHAGFSPSSLLLSACSMLVPLPPGPLRPAGDTAAGAEGGRQGSKQQQAGPHRQLLLFDTSFGGGSFAGLEYIVSALKADTAISFAPEARVSSAAGNSSAAGLFTQMVAYGREEEGLLAKHPLHDAWLEQAGLTPDGSGNGQADSQ